MKIKPWMIGIVVLACAGVGGATGFGAGWWRGTAQSSAPMTATSTHPVHWDDTSGRARFSDGTSDNYVAGCVPTTSGDYCGWDGSKWTREPAPSASTSGVPTVYFQGVSAAGNSVAIAGPFWNPGQQTSLGNNMMWDAWADIGTGSSSYIISDGNGGAHALLWSGTGGNIFLDDGSFINIGCDDNGPSGIMNYYRVSLSTDGVSGGTYVVDSINGVACGRVAMPSLRQRSTQSTSNGYLFVGGSDHSNATFYLAWMRGFDQSYPYGTTPFEGYVPPKFPASTVITGSTLYQASIVLDATKTAAGLIPDLSNGYNLGTGTTLYKHDAWLFQVPGGGSLSSPDSITNSTTSAEPLPQIVYRTGTALDSSAWPSAPDRGLTPPSTPVGAKIFDSFSRADQTFAHTQNPTLGSTEAGSLGAKTWQYGVNSPTLFGPQQYWGIFNGRAVDIAPNYGAIAWVTNDSADMKVCVDRRTGTYGNGETGVAFRVQDAQNYWFASWANVPGAVDELDIGFWNAGSITYRSGSTETDGGWTTLCAQTSGTTITISTDGTVRHTYTGETWLQAATGAGIVSSMRPAGEQNSLARFDNFTVY